MKASVSRKIAIVLLIFNGYFHYNLVMNQHVHLYHGHVISHAHPFHAKSTDKGPYSSHSHNDLVYFLLDQIVNFNTLIGAFTFLGIGILAYTTIRRVKDRQQIIPSSYFFFHTSRPPPVMVSC